MVLAIHGPVKRRAAHTPNGVEVRRVLLSALALVATLVLIMLLPTVSPTEPILTIVQVSEEDAASIVHLHVGDTLQVTLEGNPSTGYSWVVVAADSGVIRLSDDAQFKPYRHAVQLVGSPGLVTMPFAVVGAGQTRLKLVYWCPFEHEVSPLKTFEVALEVSK